jgi:hypothetical protein
MVNWLHGRIKEVARVFHNRGINSISYETTPNSVVFFCEGFWLATYKYRGEEDDRR